MRQYIGARYMPKFLGTYNATTAYEALSVVDNGQGTTYVSNKPVPAGTPLTNTEYWVVYGTSSGSILNLQDQINDMKDGEVEGSLQNQIDALSFSPDNNGYNNIVLISDSYGDNSVTGGKSWITITKEHITDRTITDHYWGGAGFAFAADSGFRYETLFGTLTADDSVELVVILTGANDGNLLYNSQTQFADIVSGVKAALTVLKTKYPNARIRLGFVGKNKNVTINYSYMIAATAYKYACEEVAMDYITNSEYVLTNHNFIVDQGIHPSLSGSEEIAKVAKCAIYNQDYNYVLHDKVGTAPAFYADINNNTATFRWFNSTGLIGIGLNQTVTPRTPVTIPNFVPAYFAPNTYAGVAKEVTTRCDYTGSQNHRANAIIEVVGSDLVITVLYFDENDMTAHEVTALYLKSPFTFNCDTGML